MVSVETKSAPELRCSRACYGRPFELSDRRQRRDSGRRSAGRLDEHKVPHDLHEHGAWQGRREDLLRSSSEQALRQRNSLAWHEKVVSPRRKGGTSEDVSWNVACVLFRACWRWPPATGGSADEASPGPRRGEGLSPRSCLARGRDNRKARPGNRSVGDNDSHRHRSANETEARIQREKSQRF